MALTIGFDATPAVRQTAGIGRYTRELLAALAARSDPFSYRVMYAAGGAPRGSLPPLDGRFRVRPVPLSDRVLNAVWQRARLPIPVQAITGRFDVFHSPDFSLPPTGRTPAVLTIHDLAFLIRPECAYPTLRAYLERVVPVAAHRATAIIAVSEATRRDVIERLGEPADKIVTVLEAVDSGFASRVRDAAQGWRAPDAPYILSVGTLEPRKNYPRLLQAYALLRERGVRHELVIAGARGWLYDPIFSELARLNLGGCVRFVQPDDAGLMALYAHADAFVYPSLYEGFGLPALEGLAAGIPTACSNTSSLPEVVGDAAVLFDPQDPEAIAGALWDVLADDEVRVTLRAAGPTRAALFSWDRAAAETVDVYRVSADG